MAAVVFPVSVALLLLLAPVVKISEEIISNARPDKIIAPADEQMVPCLSLQSKTFDNGIFSCDN